MRSLKESILSTTKVGKFDEWNVFKKENAHPKNKVELKKIILQAIKLKGNKVDLNWIDVSNAGAMGWMFDNSKFNGDLSKWDVSKVEDMWNMFRNCPVKNNPPEWYKQ